MNFARFGSLTQIKNEFENWLIRGVTRGSLWLAHTGSAGSML
jgi:hypothetical protein